jgi:effector-binding domain-containing protein
MRVALTIYHGSYTGLPEAWAELAAWIKAEGLRPAEDLWEMYLITPDSSRKPQDWRTELNWPLLD